MSEGYIYILFNPAFRSSQLKIGKTTKTPVERAKELSAATGVPEPFEVLYHEQVIDCHAAESLMHSALHASRTPSGKEFFVVELKDAIRALTEIADQVGRVEVSAQEDSQDPPPSVSGVQHPESTEDVEYDVEVPEKVKASGRDSSREQREYLLFWMALLDRINRETARFRHIRPTAYYHRPMIPLGNNIDFFFTLNKKSLRTELFIANRDRQYNKEVFASLSKHKGEIEQVFGAILRWQEHKKDCGIKYQIETGDYRNQGDWEVLTRDALSTLLQFEKALTPYLRRAI